MPTLSKGQVQTILDNTPAGVDKMDVLSKLVEKGYQMEGVDPKAAQDYVAQRQAAKTPEDPNLGTGFEPTAEYSEQDSGGTKVLNTIKNIPKSAFNFGKNIVDAVVHPLRTISSVADLVKGAGGKLGEIALEHTDFGQHLLAMQNEKRVAAGMKPFQADANGKLQVEQTPEIQQLDQVGKFLNARYGSVDKFKKSLVEDPVGVTADIAGVLTGAGAGLRATGWAGDIANVLSKAGEVIDPISNAGKFAGATKDFVAGSTAGKITKDIVPGAARIQQNQIIKALDLTQGDLAEISKSTGHNPADFIVEKNIIGGSPEEISNKLDAIKQDAMTKVRAEIKKVDKVYSHDEIPAVKDGLTTVLNDVEGIPGLEKSAAEIRDIIQKPSLTLEDVQRAKELLDENSNLYSKFGDVKSSAKAKGLANLRASMRKFIEDEVTTATGGQTDIHALNNDVQTSHAISDKIETRATRDLTRQQLNGFDLLLGVGGSAAFSPLAGIGIVIAKKIMESPTFRLSVARAMKNISDIRMSSVIDQLTNGALTDANKALLKSIMDEAKKNAVIINPALNDLENSGATPPNE